MTLDAKIHFHNMEGSDALRADVERQVTKLGRFHPAITGCEVTVSAPHHHSHKGHVYRVMIKLQVPGDTLVVDHGQADKPEYEDCYVAIHDAFKSARRRLQDSKRARRREARKQAAAERHRRTGAAGNDDATSDEQ